MSERNETSGFIRLWQDGTGRATRFVDARRSKGGRHSNWVPPLPIMHPLVSSNSSAQGIIFSLAKIPLKPFSHCWKILNWREVNNKWRVAIVTGIVQWETCRIMKILPECWKQIPQLASQLLDVPIYYIHSEKV